jgi:hypothetical protein
MKAYAPATQRNREPILAVLRQVLPAAGRVLEIASGSGEHAVYFARALPELEWQPSDADPIALASIAAYRGEVALDNLLPPRLLDVTAADWELGSAISAIVCINMIHIAPWSACQGLCEGAARHLEAGAPLVLYGPFRFDGLFTAPSNEAFDRALRDRNPTWGVRDLTLVTKTAERHGFERVDVIAMPANNHSVIFRRR